MLSAISGALLESLSIMKKRLISIELERALVYQANLKHYPPLGTPFGSATPFSFQSFLQKLLEKGWEPIFDPTTGVVLRVRKERPSKFQIANYWTCTSDVTTGIFETTLPPLDNIFELEKEQRFLDKAILPLLGEEGLFMWYTEATPVTQATRQYYALFHTYWRGEYAHLRKRGVDHYWFSWILGNNPSLDVSVQEAIPFLRIIIRLTGITFFFLRLGAICGSKISPNKMLSIRPWAWRNLFLKSPYNDDLDRVGMPEKEITSWHDYFSYLMRLRLLTLFSDDGLPLRIFSDPTFFSFWKTPPISGWDACSISGQRTKVYHAELTNLERLQRQIYISRLRFNFSSKTNLDEFGKAFAGGETALEEWLDGSLEKLYIEVRSDSCPPKDEEFSTLALYLGLLTHLDETFEYVVNNFTYDFWKKVFTIAPFAPMDSKVDNIWIPELLEKIIDLSTQGLKKRGLKEESFLEPLSDRVRRKTTPADIQLQIFKKAGNREKAIRALAEEYGLFPK
ncbi:MAG: hypothetical protein A3B74_02670 [Candidatus Kerfeldbacteria bacterium RIFCSPHIGHO2_02_FULL_42_14]|uniref:Glutamate--cysteine ligase n=1 Tax=Candidatus Kerfeldbacteria bacterium RIFCSPHIGHO2_02_FULL_42_14 TaxID=1798540 RepID=A0A1G2ARW6_9BACT|nr:MAG: hypothetical protein A3B74_02670 [Candidatus Kerfeldbacteria bacterium RIFCSPHIGHO2_02_FULL_42_14]OGY80444.1 MAG: hypothetical protein A3E60_05290 [Candidatus Kerfeldbacteria bacterium RIFCSPHIGHO2_12_FULL_42_13]OGY83874.1 MAG: hypothetical protein A3I91_04815 [Candidatus Kerfeldbacteria bacterium RIFCSPLOWO2_02_FULL_42_19]OGY86587.1 MAG: hypothetical protein A3G01_05015 [Candidatus Kerfeldbacteria bacterium RIFCSPLOWO2_12_FULL_43_9]